MLCAERYPKSFGSPRTFGADLRSMWRLGLRRAYAALQSDNGVFVISRRTISSEKRKFRFLRFLTTLRAYLII